MEHVQNLRPVFSQLRPVFRITKFFAKILQNICIFAIICGPDLSQVSHGLVGFFAYVAEVRRCDTHFFLECGMESLAVAEATHFSYCLDFVASVAGIFKKEDGFADAVAVKEGGEILVETLVDDMRQGVFVGPRRFSQLLDIQFCIKIQMLLFHKLFELLQ